MANIYDLSDKELYQLKSINPTLSEGWEKSLSEILPKLDKNSQQIVYHNILSPRGVTYDQKEKRFKAQKPDTLDVVLKRGLLHNRGLLEVVNFMQTLVEPITSTRKPEDIADDIEAVLFKFDSIELEDHDSPTLKYEIRKAFLYDLANWIDGVNLEIQPGIRQLNAEIVKSYFKEVYIKQQIQGWDFRCWDFETIQHMEHFPDWVKAAICERKCLVVESPHNWFLIGQAEKAGQNPYAFRRFLFEDGDSLSGNVFITHTVISRSLIDKPEAVKQMKHAVSRIFTLDRTVSEAIRNFVRDMKGHHVNNLRPLLRQELKNDGGDLEETIQSRMTKYEKNLSMTILRLLPRIVTSTVKEINDQEYLFYHLESVIKQMIEDVQNFRLQPATRFSIAAEQMGLKLTTFSLLLHKLRTNLVNVSMSDEEITDMVTEPIRLLHTKYESSVEEVNELDDYHSELENYQKKLADKGLLARLRRGKAPDYTAEDIQAEEDKITEDMFMYIVRLAKQKRNLIIYPEFEIYQEFDENYRHYAFADGKMGIEKLPRLVRLPENRDSFKITSLKWMLYFDVFKVHQNWNGDKG